MIQRVCLLEPLLAQPADNLEIGDHRRSSAFANLDGIIDVVEVTVRDQDVIGFDRVDLNVFCERIRCNERIEEKGFASELNGETGMAIVGEFHGEMGLLKMLTTEDTEDTEFSNKETLKTVLGLSWRART
jgi:hypothetical protein